MPIRFIFLHYIDDILRKVEGDSMKTVADCQLITLHFTVYIRDTEHIPEAGVFLNLQNNGIIGRNLQNNGNLQINGRYKRD